MVKRNFQHFQSISEEIDNERMGTTQNSSKKIDFDNSINFFKGETGSKN